MNRNYIFYYPITALLAVSAFAIGGSMSYKSAVNNTLKMCNQKPLECKFKYDILMYNETGKVPYTTPQPKPQEQKK
jgi:hypothetical protein